jgi:Zn-dependent peptidase ImmA (M78 family)/transcriptional regulator with XRE-family HTH domain
MAIDQVTIGRRLKEARLNCGLTQEEAAEAVGIARTAVVSIEAGKRSVSTLELSKFAELYHRPVTYFLEPDEAVVEGGAEVILHRLPTGWQDDPLVKNAVAWCSEICRIGTELETLLGKRPHTNPPVYDLPAPRRAEEAIEQGVLIAEEERRRLGLGFAPIADVSDLIATQGIWASGVRLPNEMSGLFIRTSSRRMVILVHVEHPRVRKRFSYAHEYAHAILDRNTGAIVSTNGNSQDLVEKRANAFAAAFLMPQAGVHWFLGFLDKGDAARRQYHVYDVAAEDEVDAERRAAPRSQRITYEDVSMLAMHFGTSYESAVYRLRDLRILKPSEKQALLEEEQVSAAQDFIRLSRRDLAGDQDREIVRDIAYLAIEAYRREEVSMGYLRDLSGKLGIEGDELVRLAEVALND